MKKVLLSWSSGKDCGWSLHLLRQIPGVEVVALVTTLNAEANRVAMHAVRRELLETQAERTGLPLWAVDLPWPCSNEDYESRMRAVCERARAEGIGAVAFGDLFLEDVRAYRVKQLAATGLEPLFPAWGIPTADLAREMIATGVKARITCVDPSKLPSIFVGRDFDQEFLNSLPPGVDPCGENGEFHSFVYDAPVFSNPIRIRKGVVVQREGFVFADLAPDELWGGAASALHASLPAGAELPESFGSHAPSGSSAAAPKSPAPRITAPVRRDRSYPSD